jgi:hypothetical protein
MNNSKGVGKSVWIFLSVIIIIAVLIFLVVVLESDSESVGVGSESARLDSEPMGTIQTELRTCEYVKGKYAMRVYDEEGRVTGVVDGECKREIPRSFCFTKNEIDLGNGSYITVEPAEVIIFDPNGSYIYDIVGIISGHYNFANSFAVDGENIVFNSSNIPILAGEIHRYTFDWDELANDGAGAIIQIDGDGDGNFENSIVSDVIMTCSDYVSMT